MHPFFLSLQLIAASGNKEGLKYCTVITIITTILIEILIWYASILFYCIPVIPLGLCYIYEHYIGLKYCVFFLTNRPLFQVWPKRPRKGRLPSP